MKKIIAITAVIALSAGVYFTVIKNKPAQPKILYYANPMDPSIHSDKPMKDPMGMDYVPVYEDEEVIGESKTDSEKSGLPGYTGITITPEKQQMIGVKKEKVTYRNLTKIVKSYGRISHDTELYNIIQEYKNAAVYYNDLKKSGGGEESLKTARTLIESVEFKLRLMGFKSPQIQELASGSVSFLIGGKSSKAMVYAEIYEQDISFVKTGQTVKVTSAFMKNRTFTGRIIAVDPSINPEVRTLRTRIIINNLPEEVKHESYVDVEIMIPAGNLLSIPEDSVIDTGERKVVFVDKGGGRFEPRVVKLGRYISGYYEVLSGISDGETIVTGANFLIDSESQLKAALKGM